MDSHGVDKMKPFFSPQPAPGDVTHIFSLYPEFMWKTSTPCTRAPN